MKELSEMFRVSKQTITTLCKDGWFDTLTLPSGGRKLITTDSVERFINLNTKKGTAYGKKRIIRSTNDKSMDEFVVSPSFQLKRKKEINDVKEKEC